MPAPTPLTSPQLRALRLVAEGKVTRIYRTDRNAFRLIPGMNATALWSLLRLGLIKDGGAGTGICTMILTEQGQDALMAGA